MTDRRPTGESSATPLSPPSRPGVRPVTAGDDRATAVVDLAEEVAWIEDGPRVLFVRCPRGRVRSALTELVVAVWQAFPRRALRLLRRPIHVQRGCDPFEREVVRVGAKRVRIDGDLPAAACTIDLLPAARAARRLGIVGRPPAAHAEAGSEDVPGLHRRMEAGARRGGHRARQDRSVAATLWSADGRLLAWARNRNGRVRVRHAELTLVQAWCDRYGRLPHGGRIDVSLEPCRMCAAAILQAWDEPEVGRVRFELHDAGPWSRGTALQRSGLVGLMK